VYQNPPIEEAVCTFRFEPGSARDSDRTDALYALLRNRFVHRDFARHTELRVTIGHSGPTQEIHILDEALFTDESRTVQIRVGPNLLTVQHREPYGGWERFWSAIQMAYNAFREVEQPKAINGISLRYVNTIELPDPVPRLDHYFAFHPHFGEALPVFPEAFMVAAQTAIPDSQDMLRIHLGNAGSAQERWRVILDLEVFLARPPSLPLDGVDTWLHRAHRRVGEAFEACIKDPLRDLFGLRED